MDVTAWSALGALAFAVLGQALVGAWHMGRLHERQSVHTDRLSALEGRESSRTLADIDVVKVLAEIQATLKAMGREIGEIKAEMHGPR